MAKLIKRLTVTFAISFVIFIVLYTLSLSTIILSLCITMGTIFFHLSMRLLVGYVVNAIFHNNFNYNKRWFRVRNFEKRIYKFLKINKLKKVPTYSPSTFSTELHSFEEIVEASCQAEIVHEIIFVLSYAPLFFTFLFGEFLVFLITSIVASLIDLFFVFVQRYKRSILVRFIKRHNK